MKIAIIAWGSLIWSPRSLRLADAAWKPDGPLLPIEFLRISDSGKSEPRLTLVISDHAWVRNVRTLWTLSAFDNLDAARGNLAARERLTGAEPAIGFVERGPGDIATRSRFGTISDAARRTELLESIDKWLRNYNLQAAIWTDLGPNRSAGVPTLTTADEAVGFASGLVLARREAQAKMYVERTPSQVRTYVREQLEVKFGWLPRTIASPVQSPDDSRFKEWAECRATVGRLDTILEDLRKYGFSIVTGLITAGAFLNFTGVQTSDKVVAPPIEVRVAVFIAIMGLVAALFILDTYYELLLSGAVERALDLEAQTDPPIRLSKYLSYNATVTSAVDVTKYVYFGMFWTTGFLGLVMLARALFTDTIAAAISTVVLVFFALLVFGWIRQYRRRADERAGLSRVKAQRMWYEGRGKVAAPTR